MPARTRRHRVLVSEGHVKQPTVIPGGGQSAVSGFPTIFLAALG